MPTGRPVLTVALDEDTYRSFREWSAVQGVSMAGLVEAFGRALGREPKWLGRLVRDARRIDNDRRKRQPD